MADPMQALVDAARAVLERCEAGWKPGDAPHEEVAEMAAALRMAWASVPILRASDDFIAAWRNGGHTEAVPALRDALAALDAPQRDGFGTAAAACSAPVACAPRPGTRVATTRRPSDMASIVIDHELKTWPEYFAAVWARRKTTEVRPADRPFREGDAVQLREWSEESGYSGRSVLVEITYLLKGGKFGIAADHCVFSFREITRKDV